MVDGRLFLLFLAAATLLAITPGPGIFYVLSRSLAGGRREGYLSAAGTFAGGLVHVLAAGVGISAILVASRTAFEILRYGGAAYLIFLGIGMIRTRDTSVETVRGRVKGNRVFQQGILTEVLNPKTALFFLSFLPQFVNPKLPGVTVQFLLLGLVSVTLNTIADFIVVALSVPLGVRLRSNTRLRRNQRTISGAAMIGLGAFALLGDARSK
ncbi:MAG: LysE family translocator [Acidobacteria bacterium]|nr:LysE family translocator [Acidobacteriota bacterium]